MFLGYLFTSLLLLEELNIRGFIGTGTIRVNRFGKEYPELSKASGKSEDWGFMDTVCASTSINQNPCKISVTQWMDNAAVTLTLTQYSI